VNTVATFDTLVRQYAGVRAQSLALCATLEAEDMVIQSMPGASPAKWHLAHTTWFFEQFLLGRDPQYQPYNRDWAYLFNSYYQSIGPMHARGQRGLLSRPTVAEILRYREAVDEHMQALLDGEVDITAQALLQLGLNHEQQHQELLLTDIKHALWTHPLHPAFRPTRPPAATAAALPLHFLPGAEGLAEIGWQGQGFAFDNETPRHKTWLAPHALANRLVTNGEYLEFIKAGGYRQPTLWLAEGWDAVRAGNWKHPLFWVDGLDAEYTLDGMQMLNPVLPVCHISYFEADAYARWAEARLPTEAEWEVLASGHPVRGNFVESGALHPQAAPTETSAVQLYGDVWEWTASPYVNYPGYKPLAGAVGEYNGKFMASQLVLRGGSCATPQDHLRPSYRNFFYPADRWQFMGLRLGRDA